MCKDQPCYPCIVDQCWIRFVEMSTNKEFNNLLKRKQKDRNPQKLTHFVMTEGGYWLHFMSCVEGRP